MKEYDERFREMIKAKVDSINAKADIRALCYLHYGKMPKKDLAEILRKKEAYAEQKKVFESEAGLDKLKAALEDDVLLDELAKEGQYDNEYDLYCRKHESEKERLEKLARKQRWKKLTQEISKLFKDDDILESLRIDAIPVVLPRITEAIEERLKEGEPDVDYLKDYYEYDYDDDELTEEEEKAERIYSDYISIIIEDGMLSDYILECFEDNAIEYLADYVIDNIAFLKSASSEIDRSYIEQEIWKLGLYQPFLEAARKCFPEKKVLETMMGNPYIKNIYKKREARLLKESRMEQAILDRIPENVIDLYPRARRLHRKFILHIGPTNSGKTHSAMEELKKAGSGVYLAPLRLLAFEQYENLNESGYPCTLRTGEEHKLTEGSMFTSSTIEMADYSKNYAYAVIDEAQMLSDKSRGGAWTAAILGLYCQSIAICMSPDAEDIIVSLINMCDDEYEIVRHERKVPLIMEKGGFNFPSNVTKGDALIVFSKKNVHAVASELQRRGVRCSIIYGALPYDVRHEEARKFADGETDVLVATDAIGMGMNLPISRVVFLELIKYDGIMSRMLRSSEIKQIAGRAGRYGKYDKGFVSSSSQRKIIRSALNSQDIPISTAVLSFPESLVGIDEPLSEIITRWLKMENEDKFKNAGMTEKMELCKYAENYTSNKYLTYDLIMLSFDPTNELVLNVWKNLACDQATGKEIALEKFYPEIPSGKPDPEDLANLETDYKVFDLIYSFSMKFGYSAESVKALEKKEEISKKIIEILKMQKLSGRKCKYCGKPLEWNYPYGMCNNCHEERYPRRSYYYGYVMDDWDDSDDD